MKLIKLLNFFKKRPSLRFTRFIIWRKLKHINLYRTNKKNILRFGFTIGLVIISQFIIFKLFKPGMASAWYNESWLYRKAITFDNSGSTQTNQKVSITQDTASLITAGKLQSSCQDIRFTTSSSSLLDHKIKTGIRFKNVSQVMEDNLDTSVSFSHSVTSGVNQILVVVIHGLNSGAGAGSSAITISQVTYGAAVMTEQESHDVQAGSSRRMISAVYTLLNPDAGSNTVSITFGGNVRRKVASAMLFTGVDQNTPVGGTAASDGGNNSTFTLSGTTSYSNSYIVGGVGREHGASGGQAYTRPAVNIPGRQTYYDHTGTTDADLAGVGGFKLAASAGSHDFIFSTQLGGGGTQNWNAVFIELKESPGCNRSQTKFEVLIPSISSGSNKIYMYYGNPSADDNTTELTDGSKSITRLEDTDFKNATSSASLSFTHTTTSASNRALIVIVHAQESSESDEPRDVTSVFYNGNPLYKQGYVDINNSNRWQTSEIWMLLNPDVGSYPVTINTNAATIRQVAQAITFKNVEQKYFFHEVDTDSNSLASIMNVNITTTIDGSMLVAGAMRRSNNDYTIDLDSPGTQTYDEDTGEDGDDTYMEAGGGWQAANTAGSQNVNFSTSGGSGGSGSTMNAIGIALQPDLDYDEFTPSSNLTAGSEETQNPHALYLKFDEGVDNSCPSGKDSCDSGKEENDATNSASMMWRPEDLCVSGKCLFFDGSDDIVTVTNTGSIDLNDSLAGSFTISTWIRANSDGESNIGEIYDKGGTTYLRTTNEGSDGYADLEASLDLGTAGSMNDATVTITNGINLNRWHHIALTYTDDSDDEITLYIDGVARGASTNGNGAPATDTSDLLIGGSTGANFHGFIDEFKIYFAERTAAQIRLDQSLPTAPEGASAAFGDSNKYLSDGLVGYWKEDETSNGASATDYSGNNITLSDTGTVVRTMGKFGNSGDFESLSSQYQYAADNDYLSITGNLTLSAWIRPESVSAGSYNILGKWDTSNESYRLFQNGDEIRFELESAGNYAETTSTNLTASNFYHVAGVYDTATRTAKIYINGQETASAITGTIPSTITNDTGRFQVGTEDSTIGAANFYDGYIDEVRVYKRSFNATEISSLYRWGPRPVLHYPLNENKGTTSVNDISGNGNTGTLIGSMTESDWVPGKFGSALDFDGSNDAITVITANDSYLDFNSTEAFSGSAWVYITTMPGSGNQDAIITKYDQLSSFRGYRLVVENDDNDSTGNFQIEIYDESTDQTIIATGSDDTVTQNTWYHLAFTFNGGTAGTAGDLNLYTNGVFTGTNPANASFLGLDDVFSDFTVGDYDSTDLTANNTAFTGVIDDVRIYNYIRNPQQIMEDMNADHPVPSSPISNPVGRWKFDEGYGINANDSSINGNTLTLSTASWTNSGKFNKAWNGTGALWLSRANDADFDFSATDDFTISAWFKSDSATNPANGIEYILSTTTGNTDKGYSLYANTNGTLCFAIDDDTNWDPDVSSCTTSDYYDATWHHILGVRNVTTDTTKIYIDAVEKDSDTDNTLSTLDGDNVLYIGDFDGDDNGTSGTEEFAGDIDEVSIFRSALSDSQIKILYSQSSAAVWGASSTDASGNASFSADRSYCPPGDTTANCSPVGEWKLDENTDTTANDTSGKVNSGNITAGNGSWIPGKIGPAYSFDGASTVINAGSGSTLDDLPSAGMTVQAWIYPKSAGENSLGFIMAKNVGTSPSNGWILRLNSTTSLTFTVDGSTDLVQTTNTSLITQNAWNHVVVSWDGVITTAASAHIYINGVEASYATSTNGASRVSDATSTLYIGNDSTGARTFDGYIDDVKAYNYAQSLTQIAWAYNRGAPIAHWKFDECAGTTAYDAGYKADPSLTRYDGTITPGASGNTSAGICNSGTSTEMWNDGSNGKMNGSLGFDGTDDYVDTSNITSFNSATSLSVSAWIYTDTLTGGDSNLRNIVSKEGANASGNSFTLRLNTSTDQLEFYLGGGAYVGVNSSAISANRWYHVIGTWDGTTMKLYINGQEISSATKSGATGSTSEEVKIGSIDIGSGQQRFWSGQIDEVKIFNYGLTAQQVRTGLNDGAIHFAPLTGTP